jgi:hypothetical protein
MMTRGDCRARCAAPLARGAPTSDARITNVRSIIASRNAALNDARRRAMASSTLEFARRAHEDIERLERACVKVLKDAAPTTHRARLTQNHIVDRLLEASTTRAKRLVR